MGKVSHFAQVSGFKILQFSQFSDTFLPLSLSMAFRLLIFIAHYRKTKGRKFHRKFDVM